MKKIPLNVWKKINVDTSFMLDAKKTSENRTHITPKTK
ncbi:MAG: hypothetical protein AMQ22_02224 [Candidatus Methanofastidiosum methylothiophilum]|uniref:Uncharacterized protein n=1 Tax=Candidatus Methanofastidiosum methylothiophilum TaxID=1705564 RepID=A0A150IJN8_9EURY|nr:MAG: hypothetical protein AMQ22_02224 [Candidatus Methanofastidiosum methylthiophilus]